MAQGKLRRKRCLLDTGRTPGVSSQAPANRGSGWVRPRNRDTRGNKMQNSENLNSTFDKTSLTTISQGEAFNRSERPGELNNAETGNDARPKIRVRFSGAARRRYKKRVLGVEEAQEVSSTPAAFGTKLNTEEAPESKTTKPEHNTSSPSDGYRDKKARTEGFYAQTTKRSIKMALVLEGHPEKKIGASEVATIKRLIRARILSLSGKANAPNFISSWEKDGVLIIVCANKESEEWLKNHASEIKIEQIPLRALTVSELSKRHRVVVHVEEPDIEIEEALKLLNRQNIGLATGDWVVTRKSLSRDATSAHFSCLIGDSALEALKLRGFRPFCGLGRATIKVFDRDRRETSELVEVSGSVETV